LQLLLTRGRAEGAEQAIVRPLTQKLQFHGEWSKGTRLLLQNETFFGRTGKERGPAGARPGSKRGSEEQATIDFLFLIRGLWHFVPGGTKDYQMDFFGST
jgi:hypothetical protein